jgi:ferrous iron transport protein A
LKQGIYAQPKGAARRKLGELRVGESGVVEGLSQEAYAQDTVLRLLRLGFVDGERVTLLREAPFTGDPIIVKVRGTLVGLRRCEANLVEVQEGNSEK